MKKILFVLAFALAFALPSFGQSADQTQAASANAANSASNQGVVTNVVSNSAPNTTANNVIEQRGHSRVDTTPSVFAPGNSVSSGGYNCGGTDSIGVAVTGVGVSGGKSRSLRECVRLFQMDKAKERATGPGGDVRYIKVWDALFCMDEDGAKAYEAAGIICPQDEAKGRERAATMQIMQQQVITDAMTGRPIK